MSLASIQLKQISTGPGPELASSLATTAEASLIDTWQQGNYCIDILVTDGSKGRKTYQVEVDTGSTELIILEGGTPPPEGTQILAEYGDGSMLTGYYDTRTVILGNVCADCRLGVATSWTGNFESAYNNGTTGIMGFAFGDDSFFAQLLRQDNKMQDMFSLVLGAEGSLTLGRIDDNYQESQFLWTPMSNIGSLYGVKLKAIEVVKRDRTAILNSASVDGANYYLDSGCTLLNLPSETIQALKDGTDLLLRYAFHTWNDETRTFDLYMEPGDYLFNGNVGAVAKDYSGSSDTNIFTIGELFLKSFCTVFDRANGRIGFAPRGR